MSNGDRRYKKNPRYGKKSKSGAAMNDAYDRRQAAADRAYMMAPVVAAAKAKAETAAKAKAEVDAVVDEEKARLLASNEEDRLRRGGRIGFRSLASNLFRGVVDSFRAGRAKGSSPTAPTEYQASAAEARHKALSRRPSLTQSDFDAVTNERGQLIKDATPEQAETFTASRPQGSKTPLSGNQAPMMDLTSGITAQAKKKKSTNKKVV